MWGALSTSTPGDPPPADTENQLAEFAELAAAAIANAENKAKLRASRARVVATADETRQRLQRDVHDGAQQRLVQTVLALKLGLDAAAQGEDPVDLVREALSTPSARRWSCATSSTASSRPRSAVEVFMRASTPWSPTRTARRPRRHRPARPDGCRARSR